MEPAALARCHDTQHQDLLTPWSQPLLLDATIHNTKFLFDLLFITSMASMEQRKVCPLHLGRGAGRPGAVVLLPYANGCASQMASNARSSWKGLYATNPIIEVIMGGERWITIARRSMPSRSASSGTPPQWGMAAGEGTRPTTGRRSKSSRSTSSRFPVTGSLKLKIGHIVLVLWPEILWLDFPRAIGPFQDRVELGYISFIEARVIPVGEAYSPFFLKLGVRCLCGKFLLIFSMKYWGLSTSVHFTVDMAHTCIIAVIVIDTNTLTESHRIDCPDNSCSPKMVSQNMGKFTF
ncbi:hypothetical protein TRIUR3_32912 [Triticum urartu]|uniref:Uncharacterized protein n=1 Tax=Triticum urartu TaxID=4572 RepID=M7Z332_TRIUA|nr:hypothetical protein TRIUR3_32912 [Triticum urartu]